MTFVKTALFHKAGEGSGGGGGGDQHNLGWYATESALTTAHPTASNGDWAIVGATDTVWVWDSDTTAWKDTGAAGIELPDQTGNAGKFLTTDGTDASWAAVNALQNTATGSDALTILGNPTTTYRGINIGYNSTTSGNSFGIAIGSTATASNSVVGSNGNISIGASSKSTSSYESIAIGAYAESSSNYGIALGKSANCKSSNTISIGYYANCGTNSDSAISIGYSATSSAQSAISIGYATTSSAQKAIQLGYGGTNSDANTFKVSNANGNFEMMSADGTIPTARFTTDPVSDGTYYPTLTISSGTPTRSWSTISALQNTATGTDSIATGTATAAGNQSTAFGESAEASTQDSTAYGYDATAKTNIGATAVGASSQAVGQWSSAYGFEAQARNTNCIQLGSGTNTTSGTLKVGFKNNGNYELLNNQGFIPTDRLTKVNSTITLTAAGWSSNTQTVNVTGMTADGVVFPCPIPADQADYTSAGILCTAQAAGTLTFTCDTVPSADIDVNVVCL